MSNRRAHRLPVIDLDNIGEESQLLPLIASILRDHDTFLLENYANSSVLHALLSELSQCPPDTAQGFDANFTGTLPLSGDSVLEQYIYNSGSALQFDRQCSNTILQRLYARLLKVAQYFAQVCLAAANVPQEQVDPSADFGAKLTRYYTPGPGLGKGKGLGENPNTLADDPLRFYTEAAASGNYTVHRNAGLLAVYPSAGGLRCKPAAVAADDNVWCPVWEGDGEGQSESERERERDVLVVHVGEMLAQMSGGRVASRPLQVDTSANIVEVTLFPNLAGSASGSGASGSGGTTVASALLDQQILEFPQVAQRFYKQQYCTLRLRDRIAFYKKLFGTGETVLSLYSISRGASAVAPRLAALLPQMSNMVKRGVSQDDFLRMVTLWPQAYVLSADKDRELTVQLPKRDALAALTARSRKLDFCEHAEKWLQETLLAPPGGSVPEDVPVFRMANKRRGSGADADADADADSTIASSSSQKHAAPVRNYLSNNRDLSASPAPRKVKSQGDLLERLKEKERRSATLLQDRQRKHEQFLAIKMRQVFNIVFSLKWNQPYTITQLRSIIVDTLQDSNNPIGPDEAEEVVLKLQELLGAAHMSVTMVDGGLRVLRWDNLDKQTFADMLDSKLQQHSL